MNLLKLEYDFLTPNDEFKNLIKKYRKMLKLKEINNRDIALFLCRVIYIYLLIFPLFFTEFVKKYQYINNLFLLYSYIVIIIIQTCCILGFLKIKEITRCSLEKFLVVAFILIIPIVIAFFSQDTIINRAGAVIAFILILILIFALKNEKEYKLEIELEKNKLKEELSQYLNSVKINKKELKKLITIIAEKKNRGYLIEWVFKIISMPISSIFFIGSLEELNKEIFKNSEYISVLIIIILICILLEFIRQIYNTVCFVSNFRLYELKIILEEIYFLEYNEIV